MERKIRYGNLFVFYGKLLTEKQYEMLYFYYLNDYSMVEIAENMGISRQAVYDAIRKSNKSLENFESKMGLYGKFQKIADYSSSIIDKSKMMLEKGCCENISNDVADIIELAVGILEVNDK